MPFPAPLVIGLCGPAGAGKSTIAHLAVDHPSLSGEAPADVWPIAAPLRDGLARMGVSKQGDPALYRTCAQRLGTDLIRAHDPDHWVKLWRRNFDDLQKVCPSNLLPPFIIIDDIRFDNEAVLADALFVVVRPGLQTRLSPEQAAHPSEAFAARALTLHESLVNEEGKESEAADRLLLRIQKLLASRLDTASTAS